MAAPQVSRPLETKWTVINGPMKGSVRLMSLVQFTIGRSTECEFIVVNDPKVSRKHAFVSNENGVLNIASLNENNPVIVNGNPVTKVALNSGDVIAIGETEIQFNATTLPSAHSQRPMFMMDPQMPGQRPTQPRPSRARRVSGNDQNRNRFLIYGGILLIGFWLFSGSPKKKKEVEIRTEQQIQADIEAANKLKELSDQQAMKRLDGSLTAQQAQENYVRGFRDYKKGQFERALVSFQACLALNPEHILCNRYQRLSQRRFNELIQYEIVLGRKYRDQNQFKACRAAFRNVMVMVKDANSATYKEAKANYEACNSLVEGRF